MKKYYQIKYWNQLFNLWINHDQKKYKTLQSAQQTVISYKENKLGIKFKIYKIEIVK